MTVPAELDVVIVAPATGVAVEEPNSELVLPAGCAEALEKYLDMEPAGPYAVEAKSMLTAATASFGAGRPILAPPGIPADRLAALTDGMAATFKDPLFIADCEKQLGALLGPGFHVQAPSSRGGQFETMIASYSLMVSLSSAFALLSSSLVVKP